ncbi:ABC transporter ATP-binding protein [Devosia ginsengisoli]|uniref:ABC transporter ATP-binding protein n=1 Tax=Devosia ginsengisoli TaxID=400770 RepID=A0A5B8LY83_9HYPH|nr:ABC transporter ATP-binding protein [Devosia ginsengisoli]QDZ12771.1 ABC transporter ATP-binding protein [Devosia ginsengisoli]
MNASAIQTADMRNAASGTRSVSRETSHSVSAEFAGVTKSFGSVKALDNIDLAIEPGEFLTLLGPSGSGKSTLLTLLAGFDQPTSGAIKIGGKVQTHVPPNRRNQGIVFQSYALFPHMNVHDNLAYPLAARGIRGAEREQLIVRALERVRMEAYAERYPSQLSGGQQQRVALARAIVFNPPLLLMDESLSALDRNLREEMQFELKELHERLSATIVFVTHDQAEAVTMSDRIAVLNKGQLVQLGSPSALYKEPANKFVAGFLGEANFIEGVVDSHDGDFVRFTTTAGHSLLASSRKKHAKGEQVVAMVRPEGIECALTRPDGGVAAGDSVKSMPAVVERVVFLGNAHRYWLRAGDLQLIMTAPCSARTQTLASGDQVALSIHAHDLRIIEA